MVFPKPTPAVLFATAVIILSFSDTWCSAQLPHPLLGQEAKEPPILVDETGRTTKVEINTAALLERVLEFNTKENTYSAVWWVVLTWKDARAGDLVAARTGAVPAGSATCQRTCDSNGLPSAGCCDAIWLPHIELPNLLGYPDDQLPRYRINANATSGTVTWSTRLVGIWYAPLDFRAYPFDHQHLLMQLAIADSHAPFAGLSWQHVAKLNNTAHTKGADLSGWRVKWGKGKLYDSRACYTLHDVAVPLYTAASAIASASEELLAEYTSIRISDRFFANNMDRGSTSPSECGTYANVYNEARALYGPMVLVADIMIKRVASYYVMMNLLPVIIISLVTFVIFYMPCNALSDRMVVLMTLFLALTALQFLFEFPPANYLNALQQVVLVGYVLMLVSCGESLIVNYIAVLPQHLTNTRVCLRKYSNLFRRFRMYNKMRTAASMPAVSEADKPGCTSPFGGAKASLAGSPRVLSPVASLARAGSSMKRPGTVVVAASVGRGSHKWTRPTRLQPLSHVRSKLSATQQTPVVSPSARSSPAIAADVGVSSPAAVAESAAKECPADKALQDSLRIDIGGQPPSDTLPSEEGPQTPSSLYGLQNAYKHKLVTEAADSYIGIDTSPAPSSFVRKSIRFMEWARSFVGAVRAWFLMLVRAPGNFYNHCKEDADFAWFIASRIDKWCCLVCLVLYCMCVAVLLWVQTQVGDHKMMLGDAPGNM